MLKSKKKKSEKSKFKKSLEKTYLATFEENEGRDGANSEPKVYFDHSAKKSYLAAVFSHFSMSTFKKVIFIKG